MIKVFVCEDHDAQREKITEYVRKYILAENLDMEIVLSTGDPYELLDNLTTGRQHTGLYFLDVDLRSDINGIQLAESIRKLDPRGFIVFITTHDELLPLTFKHKVEAMDYIAKDEITGIGHRIAACIKDACNKYQATNTAKTSNYSFKMTEAKVISVAYNKIIFIETSPRVPRKVILHTDNGMYEYYGKLDEIQKQLDKNFYRCHKSYIINLNAVESVDRKSHAVNMRGNNTCFAATRRINNLMKLLTE
jgi:two-component system response regulator AgrA